MEKLFKEFEDWANVWRKRFDEIVERERGELNASIKRTLESLRPAITEARKSADVTVTQEGDKVKVNIKGEAEITDPELREKIIKHLSEKKA